MTALFHWKIFYNVITKNSIHIHIDKQNIMDNQPSVLQADKEVDDSSSAPPPSKKQKADKRKAQNDHGKRMKWKDVLLTEDNKHIASVGGVNQAMMTDPFLRGFASANNVTYSGKTKTEIMENMINVKLTMDLTNESTSSGPKSTSSTPSRRQKKAKTTKPDCLLNENADGTLYRFISTLFLPQVRDHITTLGNDAKKCS